MKKVSSIICIHICTNQKKKKKGFISGTCGRIKPDVNDFNSTLHMFLFGSINGRKAEKKNVVCMGMISFAKFWHVRLNQNPEWNKVIKFLNLLKNQKCRHFQRQRFNALHSWAFWCDRRKSTGVNNKIKERLVRFRVLVFSMLAHTSKTY